MVTLTRGSTVIAPDLVLGWESRREARSVVHPVLDRAEGDVTLRPAGPRAGVLRAFFRSIVDAQAAEDAHRIAGVWDLDAQDPPTHVRTNRASRPRPLGSLTNWIFQNGTTEVTAQAADTTPGAGPEGRTGFVRRTVTTAKTASSSGHVYREASAALSGAAGDVRPVSMWVRFSHAVTASMAVQYRLGATIVTNVTSAQQVIPANTWVRLSHSAPATGTYDGMQAWAAVSSGSVLPVGGWYDASSVLIGDDGPYFDGDSPSTHDEETLTEHAWTGAANGSPSTETTRPVPAVPGGSMRYVVADGDLTVRSAEDDGRRWVVEIPYREVP